MQNNIEIAAGCTKHVTQLHVLDINVHLAPIRIEAAASREHELRLPKIHDQGIGRNLMDIQQQERIIRRGPGPGEQRRPK